MVVFIFPNYLDEKDKCKEKPVRSSTSVNLGPLQRLHVDRRAQFTLPHLNIKKITNQSITLNSPVNKPVNQEINLSIR